MTDDEIRQSFTGARDQKKQARILAEMNLVSHAEMMDKLVSLGLANGEPLVGKTHGRKKSTPEIDEAFARALIEKDVPDEQIAKHFGVGISTFSAWRREKGIMRYRKSNDKRKTVKELQEMEKQGKQTTAAEESENAVVAIQARPVAPPSPVEQIAKRVEQRVYERMDELKEKVERVEVADDAEGLTVAGLSSLLAMLDKLGDAGCVKMDGKAIRSVTVTMSFTAQSGDTPAEMAVELGV